MAQANINSAAEVAANVENKNNTVRRTHARRNAARQYTASKRHEIPALWKVLGKARPVFTVRVSETNEVKASCIQRFMPALYADENQFWVEFMEQVNILLDGRRFCRECKALGYQPENVAEHVVFLGSAPMKSTARGCAARWAPRFSFAKERFSPVEADNYREGGRGTNCRQTCTRRSCGITSDCHSERKGATEQSVTPIFIIANEPSLHLSVSFRNCPNRFGWWIGRNVPAVRI